VFPRKWEGALRAGPSFGRNFFVAFWTRDKRHGGNFRSNYFTRFPNTSVRILQESKVDTEATKLDVYINAGMYFSFLNQIGDEVEGLAFSYSLLSDLLFSRDSFSPVRFPGRMLCSLLWLKCVTFLDMSRQKLDRMGKA
jgi:hypothetical protein